MALASLRILMQNHSGGDSVALGIIIVSFPHLLDLGPRHYLSTVNAALSKTNKLHLPRSSMVLPHIVSPMVWDKGCGLLKVLNVSPMIWDKGCGLLKVLHVSPMVWDKGCGLLKVFYVVVFLVDVFL